MKLTKMFVLSLALTTLIGLPAEARKTIKDKKKKVAEKVDTCSVDTSAMPSVWPIQMD